MKNYFTLFFFSLILMNSNAQDITGDWQGVLSVQGIELPTILHVQKEGEGYSGTMDSPKQGAFGIKVDEIQFENNEFVIKVNQVAAVYKGTLDPSGELDGTFSQMGNDLPLKMTRAVAKAMPVEKSEQADQIAGEWNGVLDVMGTQLRLVFHLSNEEGVLSGTMDSPDQNVKGIPLDKVLFKDGQLLVKMDAMRIVYTGKPNSDFSKMVGKFKQMGQEFDLDMTREEVEIEKPKRPQEPKEPFPYYQEEVKYDNTAAGNQLAGTLTLPSKEGQYPVVIMISGSGPQNRDEELLGHKPFLVIADYLTRNGIAVLRFDDRGVGGSSGDHSEATSEDFATDVLAGVEYLKTRKEIKPNQIGLVGHSEGGLIGPMVAAQSEDIAYLVMLAGPGLDGGEILLLQRRLILLAEGGEENEVGKELQIWNKLIQVLREETDSEKISKQLRELMEESWEQLSKEEKEEIGDKSIFMDQMLNFMNSPWMRFFINYDPGTALQKVSCPVLAINGELDLQVPPKENLAAIEKALQKAENSKVTIKELPKLNHLFQKTETGAPSEYAKLEETFSPDALKLIADWILEMTK